MDRLKKINKEIESKKEELTKIRDELEELESELEDILECMDNSITSLDVVSYELRASIDYLSEKV